MEKWIKLSEEKPKLNGIYLCLVVFCNVDQCQCGHVSLLRYFRWSGTDGFVFIDEPCLSLDCSITHWLSIDIPEIPFKEAGNMIRHSQVFFEDGHNFGVLHKFCKGNQLTILDDKEIYKINIDITDMKQTTLARMRKMFKHNSPIEFIPYV